MLVTKQPTVTSSRRRSWCVLIDRVFYVYTGQGEYVPRIALDLRSSFVTPESGAFIKVKSPTETWFLFLDTAKEGEEVEEEEEVKGGGVSLVSLG